MKNLNIVIWISRGQIINYLSGLCPYACNSSFSVDVKTHQVPGVAPTLFDSHSPLCIIIACGKMDAIQATFPFFSNRSSTIVPLLSILLFERFTILILRATDKVRKQVKQVAWNKTCKNKYISCWMRVIRRGKNLCFFFQHSSNIARRLYLKVSIKIVTWQLGLFLNVIVRSSLFPLPISEFDGQARMLGWTLASLRLWGTCARCIAVNETIQFYYFASSLQQEVITECRFATRAVGQFFVGIEKGFYLAPLLPHSQVKKKTRFDAPS